jgi:hypothetical protein
MQMTEFDEEADDVNDNGQMADASDLPGSDFANLNDVSPEDLAALDEPEEMTGPQDAAADADDDSGFAEPPEVMDAGQPAEAPESDVAIPQPAALSAEEAALRQERIDHPLRFSPVTGERARPGYIFLPWKPPAQSYNVPAVSGAAPIDEDSEGSGPKAIQLPRRATIQRASSMPAHRRAAIASSLRARTSASRCHG